MRRRGERARAVVDCDEKCRGSVGQKKDEPPRDGKLGSPLMGQLM